MRDDLYYKEGGTMCKKRIAVTIGTSAVTNWLGKKGDDSSQDLYEVIERGVSSQDNCDKLEKKIITTAKSIIENGFLQNMQQTRELLSAEVMTLLTLAAGKVQAKNGTKVETITKGDCIDLFYTHSQDGILAYNINKQVLGMLGFENIGGIKMEDLSARSFTPLLKKDYFATLFAGKQPDIAVFSGGFKALIPPLTHYCKAKEIPMFCLYEKSERVLRFGPDGTSALPPYTAEEYSEIYG
ncbi:hypothetical protein C4565_10070 [Candidatus Parcubacteria bacterium]|nr:MAG: hypothetical protein C4565_10070 [Candidatus Parcubacteria bacterium]